MLGGCQASRAPVAELTPGAAPSAEAPSVLPIDRFAATRTPVVTTQSGPCRQVRDGNTIAMLQVAANDLLTDLAEDPTFGGAWYEHAPCYRLVLAFTDVRDRTDLLDTVNPEVRPFIAFARSSYSNAERDQARLAIGSALAAAAVQMTIFSVSVHPEQFTVGVATEADAERARRLIPEPYRANTTVVVGNFEPTLE